MTVTYKAAVSYLGQVTAQAFAKTKTGKDQFIIRFMVMGEIDPADPEGALISCARYERSIYRVITEKTVEYFIKDLAALGFTGAKFSELHPETPGFHDFTGKEFNAYCKIENDQNGDPREVWGISQQRSEFKPENPLEAKDMRRLDDLFGKQLRATVRPAATVATMRKPAPVAALGIDDSDIPF